MKSPFNYYISSGATDAMYTLRVKFTETVYANVGNGKSEQRLLHRDSYVCNLSTDAATAQQKALAHCEQLIDVDFELGQRIERSTVDHSVINFGRKHYGQSICDVAATNVDYLVWCCENMSPTGKHAKTLEMMMGIDAVYDIVKANAEAAQDAEQARIERKHKISRVMLPYAIALQGVSSFGSSVAIGLHEGRLPSGKGIGYMMHLYAKQYGRKNSKLYKDAYAEIMQAYKSVAH